MMKEEMKEEMFVIQADQQSWVRGIWRGWLATCNSPLNALIYRDLSKAKKAVEFYSQIAPESTFIVQALPQ